jgi:hypothetical protein
MKLYFSILRAIFLAPVFFTAGVVAAQVTILPTSEKSNPLDNMNVSARSSAIGSAFAAVGDDTSALFTNPAGLAYLTRGEVSVHSRFWLVETLQETLLLGIPVSPSLGGMAVAGSYLGYGTLEGRDELGSLLPGYEAYRLGLKVGWGLEILPDFSVGLGFQGSDMALADHSYWSLAADIGVLWKPFQRFRLGAAYGNLGILSPAGDSEGAFNLGAAYEASFDSTNRVLMAVGCSLEPGAVHYLQAGVETGVQDLIFLRAGYQLPFDDQRITGLTGLTAGVGVALSDLRFDYAFLPYGDLGNSHRVSLTYQFEKAKPGKAGEVSSPNPGKALLGTEGKNSVPEAGLISPQSASSSSPNPKASSLESRPGDVPLPSGSSVATPVKDSVKSTSGDTSEKRSGQPGDSVGSPKTETDKKLIPKPREIDPGDPKDSLTVQFDIPSDLVVQGQEMEKKGNKPEAVRLYSAAIKENKEDVSAWLALANLYYHAGQKAYAIQCFEQVIQLDPANKKLAAWLERYRVYKP